MASSSGLRVRRLGGRLHLVQGSPNTVVAVDEGRVLVVDPGIGEGRGRGLAEALRGIVGGEIGELGIVLTHGHTDHLAAAPGLLKAVGGGWVAAPRLCVGLVESTELRRLAVYGGMVSPGLAAMPMVSLRVSRVLEPGEGLPLGARVLALPGHTPGSSAVVFEEEKLVAAGDAVLGERVLARFGVPFAADLKGWAESLRRLRELAEEGYTIVPGHGPVARGRRAVAMVDANLAAVERVRSYVLEKIREKPMSLDRLAQLATTELGSAEPTPRQVLLNRTALASVLAWLEEEGLAEPVASDEGPAWRARQA
jgi:glyoxylase-like metal-dependent hydrolase (beta-lactamase superfamily II)